MADEENRVFELKVGIFIAVGILIFFLIVFSIGDVHLVRKGFHINVLFNFVNGVGQSAPVRLAGVNVGQIDKIDLFFDKQEKKTKVKVLAWINDDRIKIQKDCRASINTLGLLGEKYLEISPGEDTNHFLKNGDQITGHDPVSTEYLTRRICEIADSVDVVMMRLKKGEGTIGKLLVEETIYNDLEAFVKDIKAHPWKLLKR